MFKRAMTTNDALTENLMPTHSTSSSFILDLFFKMGGMRGKSDEIINDFVKAFGENKLLALKCIFYNRDIRSGQGERDTFRNMFRYLCKYYPNIAKKNLIHIPFYGRWDDVLSVTLGTELENDGFDLIKYALLNGDKLCAKWMPRENKSQGVTAKKLASYIFADGRKVNEQLFRSYLKSYRKLLAGNTDVVENKMCKNQWGEIKYEQVPSVAFSKYRKAFYKHDLDRFKLFIDKAIKGEVKIHASAIFPHDIIKPLVNFIIQNKYYFAYQKNNNYSGYYRGSKELQYPDKNIIDACSAQWKNLPNYFPNEDFYVLPICDVSGSMDGLPMEVSISLGLYCAERNEGAFKNLVITFSKKPTFLELKGNNIFEKLLNFSKINLAENTDLEATFRLILNQAVKNNLSEEYMPKILLIISDMQFDYCTDNYNDNSLQMIDRMYREHGYKRPQIIYWNLRTSEGVPVKFDERGTALVSGFSPSILKQVLGGDLIPINIVLKTLNSERYERISL
jgi:hypothetical protein